MATCVMALYKTELCKSFVALRKCRYGPACRFAHGEEELLPVAALRHRKHKTEICRHFSMNGFCPYGHRCRFIHEIKEPEEKEKEKQTQQDKIADDDKEEKEEKVDVSLFSVPLFP